MSTHTQNPSAAKRRRLNTAASTLSRPFKSPLPKSAQRKEPTDADSSNAVSAATEQQNSTHSHKPAISVSPSSKTQTTSKGSPESDPELLSLRRKRLMLQSKLTSLQNELDTVQQALQIESSSRDDELKALKLKWRGVSQRAAEELFETAKDKIERMGGVVVWRENERQRVKRMQMWEDDDGFHPSAVRDGDGNGGRSDDVDVVVDDDDDDEPDIEPKQGDEEETFTMDMMLKSLNIDPEIVGFDMIAKQWIGD